MRRPLILVGSLALSCGLAAGTSLAFDGELRADVMVAGLACALVIAIAAGRHGKTLETRVRERTADLAGANRALRDAAGVETALRDELMMRERMVSADMLAAGVGHEMRTPLDTIVLAADHIRTIGNPESRPIVDDIGAAASSIAVLLDDLRSLARPVDDPLTAIDLAGVVDSALRLSAYQLGPRVRLERDPFAVPPVVGNAPRLLQLVINLIASAARASRPDVLNVIRITAKVRNNAVVLAVDDTGSGVADDTLAPFCTAMVAGTGGVVEIASTRGEGTTVSVKLPIATALAVAA